MKTKKILTHDTQSKIENLDGEIWNDVFGFDGLFSVSNLGRVKREYGLNKRGHIIQSKILSKTYLTNKEKCNGKLFSHTPSMLKYIKHNELYILDDPHSYANLFK